MSQPQPQQQSNQNQQANQQKPVLQKQKDTYLLLVDAEPEFTTLKNRLLQLYAGTEARIVRELRLARLLDKHTVITVCYDHDRCGKDHVDEEGRKLCQLHESAPVACTRHWDAGLDDGAVNISTFMGELQKTSMPAVLKRGSDGQILRLAYA